jgi:hypothetical protein
VGAGYLGSSLTKLAPIVVPLADPLKVHIQRTANALCESELRSGPARSSLGPSRTFWGAAGDLLGSVMGGVSVLSFFAESIARFEAPRILQCGNGKEFKGVLLVLLQKHGIRVINGRPRTPSTQGLVERANGTVKRHMHVFLSRYFVFYSLVSTP